MCSLIKNVLNAHIDETHSFAGEYRAPAAKLKTKTFVVLFPVDADQ